jgi:hypothetical protein
VTARTLTALLRREAAQRGVSVARMLQEARGRLADTVDERNPQLR